MTTITVVIIGRIAGPLLLEHCTCTWICDIGDTVTVIVCIFCGVQTAILIHVYADVSTVPESFWAIAIVDVVVLIVSIHVIITNIAKVVVINVRLICI